MAEKTILGRIIQKHDIEANWDLATDFIPKQGEIIVYDIDENYTYERFKIGDGVTNVNDLPFTSATPDWSVNDPNAAGYIENRTHWIGTAEALLTFDEDMTGREVVEMGGGAYFVKMSDVPKTAEELIGSTLIIKQTPEDFNDYSGPILELIIDETNIYKSYESDTGSMISVIINYNSGSEEAYVASVWGDLSETGLPLSDGVYFIYVRNGDKYEYAHSLSCLTGPQEVVHKLDKKYLPDFVSTVNGQTPDTNGNIDVTVPTKTSELTNDSGYITTNYDKIINTQEEFDEMFADSAWLDAKNILLNCDVDFGMDPLSTSSPLNIPSNINLIDGNGHTISADYWTFIGNNKIIIKNAILNWQRTGMQNIYGLYNCDIYPRYEVAGDPANISAKNVVNMTYKGNLETTGPAIFDNCENIWLTTEAATKFDTTNIGNAKLHIVDEIPSYAYISRLSELKNDAGYIGITNLNGENYLSLPEATKITSSMVLGLHGDTVSISGGSGSAAIYIDFEDAITVTGDMQVQAPTNDNSVVNKKYIDDCFEDVDIPSNVSAFINDAGYINTTTGSDGNPELRLPEMTTIASSMYLGLHGDGVSITDNGNTSSIVLDGMGSAQLNGDFHVQTPVANESIANKKYVDDSVAGLVDSAPATLNTLKELSAALGNDENFATTVATQIGNLETEIESVEDRLPTAISSLRNDSGYITIDEVANEVYVGDGDMPEDAKVQFIMDGSDEEELLKNELIEYIDQNMPVEGDIIQSIMEQLQGLPVFGVVDENNNITITNQLSDGVYTLKYENTDGTVADIVTFTIGNGDSGTVEPEPDEPAIINWISESINTDGTQYIGTNGENGYSVGHRINSSGVEVEQEGMCCTGYIPYNDQIIRLANVTVEGTKTAYLVWYGQDKSYLQVTAITDTLQDDGNGVLTGSIVHAGYIRITCGVIDDTSILTLDQEIV